MSCARRRSLGERVAERPLPQWLQQTEESAGMPLPNRYEQPRRPDIPHLQSVTIGRCLGRRRGPTMEPGGPACNAPDAGRGTGPAMAWTESDMRVFTRLPMHDWNATAQAARDAEAAGFDAVMTVELGHDVFAPLAVAALATERVELTPSVAVAFPRSPDSAGVAGLGPAGQLARALRAGPRQPGEGPQRAPLRHPLVRAGATAARLRAGVARGVALLGDAREIGLPQRALHADADDAGFLARSRPACRWCR